MRYVVAISGPPGAGKTSLVRGLVRQLDDACAVYMDEYERMTRRSITEVSRWAERGADFNELEVPLLGEHLSSLKKGVPVVVPSTNRRLVPRKYIIFETQFGRAHDATGPLIDMLIWIEVPLDLALARKLKSFSAELLQEKQSVMRERLVWLDGYLSSYVGLVRELLQTQAERVRPHADVIVDGSVDLESMLSGARQEVLRRLP